METLKIKIRQIEGSSDLPLPQYSTRYSSGMDLYASVREVTVIKPMERVLIPTGIAVELIPGYEIQLRPRSGLAWKNGITLLNTPGTIDADYRGEIKVILINLGQEDFLINRGDRIAQMILAQVISAEFESVLELEESLRGSGGFGSTGVRNSKV
jgi:dUTP pyrophosphatase